MRTLKKWAVGMLFVLGVMACVLTKPNVPMGDELVITGTGFTLRPPADYRVRQWNNDWLWYIDQPLNRNNTPRFSVSAGDIPEGVTQADWLTEQFADMATTPETISGDGFTGLAAANPTEPDDEIIFHRAILVADGQALNIHVATPISHTVAAETLLNAMLASITYTPNEN